MKREYAFLTIIGALFVCLAIVFLTFPRSTFSELERRDLATFPEFSLARLTSGEYTRDVSAWFSDSQPFRDDFMGLSMEIKSRMALRTGAEDEITFHAGTPDADVPAAADPDGSDAIVEPNDSNIADYDGHAALNDGVAKMANSGIIIVGSGSNVRALMAFGGTAQGGNDYASMANEYKRTLGANVKVYIMVVPTAAEFYTPDKAKKMTNRQLPTIRHIYSMLDGVKGVDAYTQLATHADEAIYLRTDHHWAPLGAYYAAAEFARVAGVPFRDLSTYRSHTVHDFVGTMYGFSKDPLIKNAPEDFTYYTPTDTSYSVTVTALKLDKNFRVTGESKPMKGRFFHHYKDGSSGAYCTFMGGDYNQTVVKTSTRNGRKLVIIKDSYGNAVPGYLFGSFEEIHVLDHRYFRHAVKDYVRQHGITDVLLINNIFNAYSSGVARRYRHILNQSTTTPAPEAPEAPTATKTDTTARKSQEKRQEKLTDQPAAKKDKEAETKKEKEKAKEKAKETPADSIGRRVADAFERTDTVKQP